MARGCPTSSSPFSSSGSHKVRGRRRDGRARASAWRSRSPTRTRSAATFATSRPSRPAPASTSSCRASPRPELEPGQRINRGAPDAHLEMQVRPRRHPARSDPADALTGLDVLADADADPGEVRIHRPRPTPVRDRHEPPPAAETEAGEGDPARRRCDDRRSPAPGKVDPRVEAVAARTEDVAVGTCNGRREGDGTARRSPSEGSDDGRTCDAVGWQTRPALALAQGLACGRAEMSIELARGESMPGKGELQRCDIPAAHAGRQDPSTETGFLAEPAESLLRARAGHSVDGQASAALKQAHARDRSRAEHAVDGAAVEPTLPQPHLEGCDFGITDRPRGGREQERHEKRCGRSSLHPHAPPSKEGSVSVSAAKESSLASAFVGPFEPACYLRPVYDVPPNFQVFRTPVLILEVVGVLPDVDAEERLVALHERAGLVGRRV